MHDVLDETAEQVKAVRSVAAAGVAALGVCWRCRGCGRWSARPGSVASAQPRGDRTVYSIEIGRAPLKTGRGSQAMLCQIPSTIARHQRDGQRAGLGSASKPREKLSGSRRRRPQRHRRCSMPPRAREGGHGLAERGRERTRSVDRNGARAGRRSWPQGRRQPSGLIPSPRCSRRLAVGALAAPLLPRTQREAAAIGAIWRETERRRARPPTPPSRPAATS